MKGTTMLTVIMTMLVSLVLFGGPTLAQNDRQFQNGCVVREWESDETPSYRVNDPSECQRLDRQLDGGDGPDRGRVRSEFRNSSQGRKGRNKN